MQLKRICFLLLLLVTTTVFTQEITLSPISKISLLTVGNADELHSKFGHTALRIQDTSQGIDIVFGYGGFDFDDPLFYSKFTTGKLDYSMTGHRYTNFLEGYRRENRWVFEQELNLDPQQRHTLFQFLQQNYKEENRYYKYDFLFDNCATKVPEVFQEVFGDALQFDFSHLQETATFRELIHETLRTNSWSAFGIDLALGSVIDRKATPWEHQFLPFYVKRQFANARINGAELVTAERMVLKNRPVEPQNHFLASPLFWLGIGCLTVLVCTYFDYRKRKRSRGLDFALFITSGIAGFLICFLWFATDHSATKVNYNMLWAFPFNLVVAFFVIGKKTRAWIHWYLWGVLGLLALMVLLWIFGIQVFSPLVIPILLALVVRYLFLLGFFLALDR